MIFITFPMVYSLHEFNLISNSFHVFCFCNLLVTNRPSFTLALLEHNTPVIEPRSTNQFEEFYSAFDPIASHFADFTLYALIK